MESLFDCVKTFCLAQDKDTVYWIAYSGGLDSHVLLHVCAKLRDEYGFSFKAIHVHHGLSPNADAWTKHCEKICLDLKIECIVKNITMPKTHGESLEAVARELRYKIFTECLDKNNILLTAHHQDDQAETILIQLMRGAGVKGLAAMPLIKAFAQGFHARPLLNVSRKELEKYAYQYSLKWINDESNHNIDFNRNYLRHEVLPILKKRWPATTETLSRVASHCAEAQLVIDEMIDEQLQIVKLGSGLSISKLLNLSPRIQRQVLRRWFSVLQFPLPSVVKMQQIQHAFLQAAEDKTPHITWGHVELRRYKDVMYAMHKMLLHDETKIYEWDFATPLTLANIGQLHALSTIGKGIKKSIDKVTVRFRQGGEFCRLPGREFHHDLKNLFQQWGVPPWERARIPLLFHGDKLIAVVGYFIDQDFMVKQDEIGVVVSLN